MPLLSEFDALQNFAADVRGVKSGKLRVGVTPMLGSLYLVDILVDFSNQYPGVELKLVENGSREIRRQLVSGDIDVGICITDPGSDYEFLENIKLFEDVMMVCVNRPLAKVKISK